MADVFENLTKNLFYQDLNEIIGSGKIGIEKESLRIVKSKISQRTHNELLGPALCHKYITTDFSEAQIELITPPMSNNKNALTFLDNIHHFVLTNIEDEILWPLSMPPPNLLDSEVSIASYGSSNLAKFKTTYRKGLSHRYGKLMQAISGVHFNYSLPASIWKSSFFSVEKNELMRLKAEIYFKTLRNIHRMNWLILYLFGASPAVSKNLLHKKHKGFLKLNSLEYYLPYATSLRMTDIGYQNINQANLKISLNSLKQYLIDLKNATETNCEDFQDINKETSDQYPQINSNLLQIEDEYYGVSRPKSSHISDQRLISKLGKTGIDYIELRSLDLNPFNKAGIDIDTVNFLELFLTYCTLSSSPPIDDQEMHEIKQNDFLVATRGREPGLQLTLNQKKISLKNLAEQIFDEMNTMLGVLKNSTSDCTDLLEQIHIKISEPDQTLSAMLLDKISIEKLSYDELGRCLGEDYRRQYMEMDISENIHWSELEKEAINSTKRQQKLEQSDHKSFDSFIDEYFNK